MTTDTERELEEQDLDQEELENVDLAEVDNGLNDVLRELRDKAGVTVSGALTLEKSNPDGDVIQKITVSADTLDTPSFHDQVNVELGEPTASNSPPSSDLKSLYQRARGDQAVEDAVDAETQENDAEATEKAEEKAKELEIDINEVEGTGSEGRVTVQDVEKAAKKE